MLFRSIDVPELSEQLRCEEGGTRGGQAVARRIVTLPTHGYVTARDQERMAAVVSAVLVGERRK